MKSLVILLISLMTAPVMASSITQLNCVPVDGGASIHIAFEKSIDPMNPWIGMYSFNAQLRVKIANSSQSYTSPVITMSPLNNPADLEIRGDSQGYLYLRLYPVMANGQATGRYNGDLFINDLDARQYFDFRGDSANPGLHCK